MSGGAGADAAADYARDGFVVLSQAFSSDLLAKVRDEMERVVAATAAAAGAGDRSNMYFDNDQAAARHEPTGVRCVFRVEDRSAMLRDLLHSDLLLQIVEPLLGDRPVADGVQYIDKPPHASYGFPYHQDNAYQFFEPALSLAATVALDDQAADSGAIELLAGSPRLPILPHQPSGVLGASRGMVDAPDTDRFPPTVPALAAGDLLIHHTNVIHRTGPNRTASHRRNLGFTYHGQSAAQDGEAVAAFARQLAEHEARAGYPG